MAEARRKKHFIAVLGTSSYDPCTYSLGKQTCETKFVQEAILKLACGELHPDDKITICLTEKARSQNWVDRKYEQWEIDKHKGTEKETYKGLCSVLNAYLKDTLNMPELEIEGKEIVTGQNDREIAQMFLEIYKVIGENEKIYFDITHGLRNIPMLVMAILEYAKVTKNISIGGIFYGAYEVGVNDPKTRRKKVPIYDLSFYQLILNWSSAANSFIKYGHADEISDLTNEKWKLLSQTATKEQKKELNVLTGNLNNVANKLQKFTASIETGRGDVKYKQSMKNCYEDYMAQKIMPSEYMIEEYYPLLELLNKVEEKMKGFQDKETNLQVGMAAIDWCIKNNMVQQGYTALEETAKTFLCEKIGVSQDKEFWRENIVKRMCMCLREVIKENREEKDKRFEEWKTSLQKEGLQDEENENGEIQKGLEKGAELYELLIGNEKHSKLVQLMDRISIKRNDINHFGFTKSKANAEELKKELKKMADEFEKIQEEWDS